ncbi:alpha/beta fold hydrolase [Alphaproteobacteria bacterium]|nr:alpha/beta fold hydrolase [Alphaproteobacteria bacterium]
MYDLDDLQIKKSTYDSCVKIFSMLQGRLGLNINFHHKEGQAEAGQIFLFNHFARFETLIPPYLLHTELGAYCRCVATKDLFSNDSGFSRFLMGVGAVPNDLPGLLPFLAAEILRGRKVIVFPEGGMVKDRRTINDEGQYGVYSRTVGIWRKHHAGAAVIALVLEIFKSRIVFVEKSGNLPRLERWRHSLGMESVDVMIAAAQKPTLIVPSNITFYPIRISDNILRSSVDFFVDGLGNRISEELLIEGNILFKDTDMDIRFGAPIEPRNFTRWWEAKAIDVLFAQIGSLDELFSLNRDSGKWIERIVSALLQRETSRLRDLYMTEIYDEVTVNMAHLASALVLAYVDKDRMKIGQKEFHRTLYLAIKYAQQEQSLHLHRILSNPEAYGGVDIGVGSGLDNFWMSVGAAGLIERRTDSYIFLPKLREEHSFDQVRIENPILVYANEITPLNSATRAIDRALKDANSIVREDLASHHFDDELKRHAWCRQIYEQPHHAVINGKETATQSGAPYFLHPEISKGIGVVLVHGFLASPAELRNFGEKISNAGYPVIGARLEGHGTSPWDLRDRSWRDWLESVRRSYRIMSGYVDRICLVGFSTGGSLVLQLAAEQPKKLHGVASISAPVKFLNRNLIFVPLLHGVNKIASWVPSLEGVMPFSTNDSEHPDINYRNIPIRGLYELRQTVDSLIQALPGVSAPTLIIHGSQDPIVDPASAGIIMKGVASITKQMRMVKAECHGILHENTGGCQEVVLSFIASLQTESRKGELT